MRTRKYKPTKFGLKVITTLYEKGMSQRELARLVPMNESYLRDILYGRRSGGMYIEPIKKVLGL